MTDSSSPADWSCEARRVVLQLYLYAGPVFLAGALVLGLLQKPSHFSVPGLLLGIAALFVSILHVQRPQLFVPAYEWLALHSYWHPRRSVQELGFGFFVFVAVTLFYLGLVASGVSLLLLFRLATAARI